MDRAGLFAALVGAVLAFGCDKGEIAGPDAGDGGMNNMIPDAGDDVSAIRIEWRTEPEVPASSWGGPWDATLSRATFRLEDLRVVGDAAILERPELEMEFIERDRPVLEFKPAAPGMYSTFIGHIDSYEIEGTVRVMGQDRDFLIQDDPPSSTTFVVQLGNTNVEQGKTRRLRVNIELDDFIDDLDWSAADEEDGLLVLSDDMLDEAREEIAEAFDLD